MDAADILCYLHAMVCVVCVDTWYMQNPLKQLADFLLLTPRRIMNCASRTLYISSKGLWDSDHSRRLLILSLSLHTDLQELESSCGNGRSVN